MDAILQDLRHAVRGVVRRPLFALIAVLSLAVGVGATTAVFGVVNTLLIQPPPGIANADRVVELGRDVARLVLRYAAGLILPGLVVGGLAGVGIAYLVRGLLIGVQPLDPATFIAVAGVLGAAVVAATVVPARRAAAVHPMEALRSE